ncbi:hypothetical protein AB0J21_04045 [Streptomyces sp. NPDC049954]|uniref:type II toxin-antitoxin system VapC family toxin n=1 Tax=Streptomyces sp. NPDC049954 TaxID=3155779 RepID=UPI00342E40ED
MIVIDCFSLVHFLLDQGKTGTAIRERVSRTDTLAAPGLLDYEITSAVFGLARGRRGGKPKITEKEAPKAITDYQSLALDPHEEAPAEPGCTKCVRPPGTIFPEGRAMWPLTSHFPVEPPVGFEPTTYALQDRERSCCVVPGRAAECCFA